MGLPMLRGMGFAPILLGVLLAQLLHTRRGFALFGRLLGHRLAPLPLALALLVSLELLPEAKQGWSEVVTFLLMMLLLGSTVVREDHVLAPLLKWRPIARIGVVSYGIYLLHLPVQMLVDATVVGPGSHDGIRFVVILAGTVLAAELSYRFYETPFLRLKTRFAR
jgi:peptidoglycan/LPS O-acetylase OafA/YrhL